MPRILFVCMHRPDRSPSQRFRFEQYYDFLTANGYVCDYSYLIEEKDDKKFYSPGNYFHKFLVFFKSIFKRLVALKKAKDFDIIFIQREAFITGTTFFERRFAASGAKVIFDFDDSIWLSNVSDGNKNLEWLKNYTKVKEIISVSHLVFAGNNYLKDYALAYNKNVVLIPTTIDTDYHVPIQKNKVESICIGWTGSPTTIQHFSLIVPALKAIKEKYGKKIYFKVIGDENFKLPELDIKGIPWRRETEIEDLHEINIGIMPLPDDMWAKGKCGLKGLQYMALEVPTIMSPVGVNTEIINEGVNGFLASTMDEWVDKLSRLVDSSELREKIGKEARKTIEANYSVNSQKDNYLKFFNQLLAS